MFWKIIIWLFFVLVVVANIELLRDREIDAYDLANIFISIPSLVALGCYAYRKRVFLDTFWKVYFFVLIVWDIPWLILSATNADVLREDIWLNAFIEFLFNVPIYICLYFYAFKFFKRAPSTKD